MGHILENICAHIAILQIVCHFSLAEHLFPYNQSQRLVFPKSLSGKTLSLILQTAAPVNDKLGHSISR